MLLAVIAPSADAATRYSFANGCYSLRSLDTARFVAKAGGAYSATARRGGAERFYMKPAALGIYLVYDRQREFLAAGSGNEVDAAEEPSLASEWVVRGAGRTFRLTNRESGRALRAGGDGALTQGGTGPATRFALLRAKRCTRYPEIGINAKGLPFRGPTSYGEVVGTIDDHLHISAFEFLGGNAHCGRPWHRYGVPYALVDCLDHTASGGCGAVLENIQFGDPARCHDTVGWPTFNDWPAPRSQTHEQTYYRWMERAWRAGVRIIVNDLVENEVLCEIYPTKRNACNDMVSVRLQAKRMRQLQNYIDAQSGGPGKGWLRIVRTPFQARRVINRGKLALVLGIEVSRIFGCGFQNNTPQCDRADVDRGLDEAERMGVASLFPIHKFDNGFGGVRFDSGNTGAAINLANRQQTGEFWQIETCQGPEHDNEQTTTTPGPGEDIFSQGFYALLPPGVIPVYPPPPHCNKRGLTGLGRYLINEMIERGIMIELDHMGVKTATATLAIAESKRYSGLLASHTWSDPLTFRRIYALGGFASPINTEADDFLEEWRYMRGVRSKRFLFGTGFGADSNGLHSQPSPRGADAPAKVLYPFRSLDERVRFARQRSGRQTYDVNVDGVAHYGLHADWLKDLGNFGGRNLSRDLFRGAEAYLQTWERAVGVPGPRCLPAPRRFSTSGLGKARLGRSALGVLKRVGQPKRRPKRAYRWCARTKRKDPGARVAAAFNRAGRLALVGSTARGHRLADVGPDAPPSRVPDEAIALGGGLFIARSGPGGDRVYGVRRGEIAFVALVSPRVGSSRGAIAGYLRLAGLGGRR